jgi:hypothetical protein
MARTVAGLPEGTRITDYISLGVIAKTFPMAKVRTVLAATGKASVRERDLPAHVMCSPLIERCCGACWKASSG